MARSETRNDQGQTAKSARGLFGRSAPRAASLGAVTHFVPDLLPLLAPGEGPSADGADFLRQIRFAMNHGARSGRGEGRNWIANHHGPARASQAAGSTRRSASITLRFRAPVAQLDRVLPSEGRSQRFESSRAHQLKHMEPGTAPVPGFLGASMWSGEPVAALCWSMANDEASEAEICGQSPPTSSAHSASPGWHAISRWPALLRQRDGDTLEIEMDKRRPPSVPPTAATTSGPGMLPIIATRSRSPSDSTRLLQGTSAGR